MNSKRDETMNRLAIAEKAGLMVQCPNHGCRAAPDTPCVGVGIMHAERMRKAFGGKFPWETGK